MESDNKIK